MRAGFLRKVNNKLLSCILCVGLISCMRDEPVPESKKVSQFSEETAERNRLVTETRDELDDWFAFYNLDAEADTLFKLREIWDTDLLAFPVIPDWQQVYKEHRKLFIPSTDKRKVLDIYTYTHNLAEVKRKSDTTPTTPDSEAAIVDIATGERVRLIFCGNVCQFHDAWWRTPDEIIIVGMIQGFDHKTLYPAIWHINTYTQSVKQFTSGSPANPDKYKNYLKEEIFD
jgi:hypothetical protein